MPGIEGLRALAAVGVLAHHTWISDGGQRVGEDGLAGTVFLNLALGVTLFFALSGFLLYRPFAAAIARGEPLPDVAGYLRNRALRILPAYWVILIATAFILQTAATRADGSFTYGAMTDPVELVKAMLLIQDYDPDSMIVGITAAWSLAVEVVFYLALPLMAIGAARLARRARTRGRRVMVLMGPPLLLLLVGLSGKLMAGVVVPGSPSSGYSADWHSVIERSFWAQADLFTFGMIAAVLHTELVDGRLRPPRGWRWGALALGAAIFIPCVATLERGQLSYLPQNTAVALAAALLVAAAAFPGRAGERPFWLQRTLEWPAIVSVGLISYSLFLWNEPVVQWLADRGLTSDGWAGLVQNLLMVGLIAGVLSVITYRLVELPALRRKRRPEPMDAAQLEAAP
jgi:peptidoglycan/LPS O-acetylase OafA/YrhL